MRWPSHTRQTSMRVILNLWLVTLAILSSQPPPASAQATTPPTPSASLGLPSSARLGETFSFTVSFVNASPDETGYGPFIDLVFPVMGADGAGVEVDDGLDFVSAAYLGAPVTATTLTFPGPGPTGCVDHPYAVAPVTGAPLQVCGPSGDKLVVLQLPFGSFTPGQPAAVVTVDARLSNLADLGSPLNLFYRSGFQFGATPTNDWCCAPFDATILSHAGTDPATWPASAVTPTLIAISKSYNGPEAETATGPNYPRRYTVNVDVADGQTITNLLITDTLPSNVQFVSLISSSPASTGVITPSLTTPGGALVRQFAGVTGGPGTADATLTLEFYVPRLDLGGAPVINPTTGDDATSVNGASASGLWTPSDPRDTPAPATVNCPNCHTLTDKAIAIQKSVANITDASNTPGDVLEYTLSFQVSDFFAFGAVVISDTFSDGQRFDAAFTPTLSFNGNGYTLGGAPLDAANYTVDVSQIATDTNPLTDGSTTLLFRVSDELVTRGQNGRLVGGCLDPAAGSNPPDCAVYNDGATTGVLRFRTIIQDQFSDTYPSGDPSVDHGDLLSNAVTVTGDVLDPATAAFTPTGQSESDDSGAGVSIAFGALSKTVYAVNGVVCPGQVCTDVQISPGDTVTYRLRYTQPASDFETTTLIDYLPLPVFYAASVVTFTNEITTTLTPGTVVLGPSDTYNTLPGAIPPTMATFPVSNTVVLTYPAYDNPANLSSEIDLLLTVQASNDPFADRLFLTNQANAREGTTNAGEQVVNAIVQVQLTQPVLVSSKAAVATSNPAAAFLPAPPGPVTFTPPGDAGPRWGGVINSTNLVTNPIDSDVTNLDAGDRVTFAIVVENTGTSRNGAFDLRLRDVLPAGLITSTLPAGLNLQVRYGDGTPVAFTDLGGGLFGSGIEIVDPGPDSGACQAHDAVNGRNIIVITYDLELAPDVQPDQDLPNTSIVTNYAGSEGGPNHIPGGLTDTATATVRSAGIIKALAGTAQAHTAGTNVAIGEVVTYTVTLTVPEGVWQDVVVTDTLDAGLAFVDAVTVTASPALTSTIAFADMLNDGPTAGVHNPVIAAGGGTAVFALGSLFNSDRDDAVTETVDITYTAVVLNVAGNGTGATLNNSAQASGIITPTSAANVTVVQPALALSKAVTPAAGDAGDPITYTVRVTNTSTLDAFNAVLTDVVPSSVSVVSVTPTGGVAPTVLDVSGNAITATWDALTVAQTSVLQIVGTLVGTVAPNQTIQNTANLQWTSLPGDVTTPQSAYNALSVERTGDTGGPGGAVNTYRASASATLTTTHTGLLKTIVGTSQAHTAGNTAAIGELITYTVVITVPEGVTPGALFTDTLDAGLAFVSLDALSASAALTTDVPGGFPAVQAAAVIANNGAGPANQGRDLRLNFGTLTNADNNNAVAETIQVTYTVGVLNTTGTPNNVAGQLRNNAVTYTWPGNTRTASAPNVTLVEPVVTVAKSAAPTTGQAGDVVTFTLQITNTSGANRATGFEVVLTDVVPSDMTLVGGSFAHLAGAAPGALLEAGDTLTAAWDSLAVGVTSTLRFAATLNSSVLSGQIITNTAIAQWTSLPGVVTASQSAYNTLVVERTGSAADTGGAANTYRATGSASVRVILHAPVKSIAATSEAHTAGDRVVVGEVVRYRMEVLLANGSSPNFQLRDNLPAGMSFLNDGTVQVALASATGAELTSSDAALNAGARVAGDNTAAAVFTLPAGNIGGTAGAPVFSLGDLTAAADATPKYVILEFNAVVQNVPGNQAGTALANTYTVRINNADLSTSAPVTATVAEPNLALVKYLIPPAPVDAGDLITYTLRITNTASGLNAATAFDLALSDTLDGALAFVGLDFTAPATSTFASGVAGQAITATVDQLAPGASVLITVTAQVRDTVTPGQVIPNAAALTYSSLPGTGTAPNPTGSTPGTERDGSGGVNDYTASGAVNAALGGPALAKALSATSAAHTAGGEVAIGEVLTYTLAVTLPEGATPGLVVTDTLPAGLEFLAGSVDLTGFNGSLPAPTISAPGSNPATFTFGAITVADDNVTGNNVFFLAVQARVLNAAGNQTGVALNNAAALQVTGGTPVSTPNVPVAVVEPALTLAKTVNDAAPALGRTLTFTLTVAHAGPSTADAHDLVITDTLPAGLAYIAGSGAVAPTGIFDESGNPVLVARLPSLALGATGTITYQASVLNTNPVGAALTNTASLTWTSLPGPDGGERDGSGGVDDYTASDAETVTVANVDLQIAKTDGQASAAPGEALTYTLTITNVGNRAASGVVVTDALPANVSFVSAGDGGAEAGGVVTWPTFTLAAGATATRTVTVQVADPVPAGVAALTNTAGVADDGLNGPEPTPADNTASDIDTLTGAPDLQIAKTDGLALALPGQTLTYTLTITNAGDRGASGVTVTDTLPADVTFLAAGDGGAEAGGVVTWPTFTLAGGATAARTVTVRVNDPLPAGVTALLNTAGVTDDGLNGPEPTPADNSATDTTLLTPSVDLIVTKRENAPAAPGAVFTYTLVYTNVGNIAATGVVITETVPERTTFNLAASGAAWSCADGSPAGTLCTVSVGAVAGGGGGGTVAFALDVATPIPAGVDTLTNTVSIGDDGASGPDAAPGDNVYTRLTPLDANPDLRITIDNGGVTTIRPGETLTFTLAYTNTGDQDATGTVITVTVPAGTTFVPGGSTPGWTCLPDNAAGSVCSFNVGGLPVTGAGTLTFTVVLDDPWPAGTPGVAISAHVTDDRTNGADPTPANNVSSTSTVPTAVTLLYFRVEGVDGQQVTLGWATASERDHFGFRLYRAAVDDYAQAAPIAFMPASAPGGSWDGAVYAYVDTAPQAGWWWYWLVDVDTAGVEVLHPGATTSALAGPLSLPFQLFLPSVRR